MKMNEDIYVAPSPDALWEQDRELEDYERQQTERQEDERDELRQRLEDIRSR